MKKVVIGSKMFFVVFILTVIVFTGCGSTPTISSDSRATTVNSQSQSVSATNVTINNYKFRKFRERFETLAWKGGGGQDVARWDFFNINLPPAINIDTFFDLFNQQESANRPLASEVFRVETFAFDPRVTTDAVKTSRLRISSWPYYPDPDEMIDVTNFMNANGQNVAIASYTFDHNGFNRRPGPFDEFIYSGGPLDGNVFPIEQYRMVYRDNSGKWHFWRFFRIYTTREGVIMPFVPG